MAQRDYEDQPEAPDLGASVQLENSETLAGPAGDRDGLDAGYVPADRPYALDDDGVTGRGMREGDTLDERLRRERPEQEAAVHVVDVGDTSAGEPSVAADPALDDPELAEVLDPETGRAEVDAVRDIQEEDEFAAPAAEPAAEGSERAWRQTDGADRDGAGWDPARPLDPLDSDPASRLDADREAGGAAAPASGRVDAGPGAGL